MRKAILATIMLATAALNANAQDKAENTSTATAFNTSSSNLGISVGFGLGYTYFPNMKTMPAIAVTYDKGFKEVGPGTIGIGGIIAYKGASYEYPAPWAGEKAKWTNIIVGARGTYHLHMKNNKFDPYAGLLLGIRYTSYSNTFYDKFPTAIGMVDYDGVYLQSGLFIGAKYNFSAKAGVFAELGYDVSLLRLGVSFGL